MGLKYEIYPHYEKIYYDEVNIIENVINKIEEKDKSKRDITLIYKDWFKNIDDVVVHLYRK